LTTTIDKIAWILLEDGKILSTRSRGKDVYYLPGGKREPGESDLDTLVREIDEELAVAIVATSAAHFGTFQAQAHMHADGVTVQMTCYTAQYHGIPTPNGRDAGKRSERRSVAFLGRGRGRPNLARCERRNPHQGSDSLIGEPGGRRVPAHR
jgi:8-oxo-dGTP pyrophosphatase MutT (NUDIX family)